MLAASTEIIAGGVFRRGFASVVAGARGPGGARVVGAEASDGFRVRSEQDASEAFLRHADDTSMWIPGYKRVFRS